MSAVKLARATISPAAGYVGNTQLSAKSLSRDCPQLKQAASSPKVLLPPGSGELTAKDWSM